MKFNLRLGFKKVGLKARKYAPDAMIVGGVALIGYGAFKMIGATRAYDDAVQPELEDIRDAHEDKDILNEEDLSTEEYTALIKTTRKKMIKKAVFHYAKPAVLISLGTGLVVGGYGVTRKRYRSSAAAYAATAATFNAYRSRVKDELGENADLHYFTGHTVETVTAENEENETKTIKAVVTEPNETLRDIPHPIMFDDRCKGFERNPYYNVEYLENIQALLNQRLKDRGCVFLNELYDMLELPRTHFGSVTGWVQDGDISKGCVDLGLFARIESHGVMIEANERAFKGDIPEIILTPNIDGNILDLI